MRVLKERFAETAEQAPERQAAPVGSPPSLLGHPMIRSGAWAVSDQTIISGTNFFTVLLVGRAVAPSEFGMFMLAYTSLWLFQNVQRALIVEPMNVLAAVKEGYDYRSYVTSTAIVQATFAVMLGGAVMVSGALLSPAGGLLFALAPAVVFWQLQEFVRRIFYIRTHVAAALLNDSISYGGQAGLLILLYSQGALTPVSAMVAISITSAIAVAVGGWQARSHMIAVLRLRSVWEAAVSNWRFGRWLLGANFFRDASGRLYVFLLVAFVGPAGLGAFAAASALARVNNVLIQSMETLLPPMASRRFKLESQADMEAFLRSVALIGLVPALIALTLLVVFAEKALHIVYGGTYDEFALVLRLVSLSSLLALLSVPLRAAFKAMEETRILFLAGGLSAVFLVTGGSVLAAVAGVSGAAWVTVIDTAIVLMILTVAYWYVTRRREARNVAV